MSKRAGLSLIITFISGLCLSVAIAATGPSASVGAPAPPRGATTTQTAPAAAATTNTVVARNAQGRAASRLVGTTSAGRQVTGSFTPLRFSRNDSGRLLVRGIVSGVTQHQGTATTFTVIRTVRVMTINGVPATARSTTARAAVCDVLRLVLGPLDLNLLGLQIDLSRIVLNITAISGAGNLLGNLLCAVAGLLDGGLGGVLNRVIALLNQILANLRLGG